MKFKFQYILVLAVLATITFMLPQVKNAFPPNSLVSLFTPDDQFAASRSGATKKNPTVSFSASPTSVNSGGTTGLSWSSANTTSCTASGGWSGSKAISGNEISPSITAPTIFTISCTGSGGTVSKSVNVGPVPYNPSSMLAGSPTGTNISLSWTDNSSNEDGFIVEQGSSSTGPWSVIASNLAKNTTSYTASGLSSGTTYYFRARAFNVYGGSGYSNTSSNKTLSVNTTTSSTTTTTSTTTTLTTDTPYKNPLCLQSALKGTASLDQMILTWGDCYTNETGFKLEKSLDNVSFTQLATLPANSGSYTDKNLSPKTTYYYRVYAYIDGGGISSYRYVTAVSLDPATLSVTGANAVGQDCGQINLTWSAPTAMDITYRYNVYRNGVLIDSIPSKERNNGTVVNNNLVGILEYADLNRSPSQSYKYEVAVLDSNGKEWPKVAFSGSTPSCPTVDASAPLSTGQQRVLDVMVDFQDTHDYSMTENDKKDIRYYVRQALFGRVNSALNVIRQNSFNRVRFSGEVVPWITLPITTAQAPTSDLESLRDIELKKLGIDQSNYNRLILSPNGYYGKNNASGLRDHGMAAVALGGMFEPYNVAHELTHAHGVAHANLLDCGSGVVLPTDFSTCIDVEYGDVHDYIGSHQILDQSRTINMGFREYLGWAKAKPILSSGQYKITPTETSDGFFGYKYTYPFNGNPQTLYFEFRNNLVTVHRMTTFSSPPVPMPTSWVLNVSGDKTNPDMRAGMSFVEPTTGARFTVTNIDGTGAVLDVQLGGV